MVVGSVDLFLRVRTVVGPGRDPRVLTRQYVSGVRIFPGLESSQNMDQVTRRQRRFCKSY